MKTILPLFAILLLLALPARTDAQAEGNAPAGMGNVVIFRSGDDSGRSYSLTYQTRTVAHLKSGTYVVLQLPEGRQYLLADPTADQIFAVDVVAGSRRYVQGVSTGNLLRRHPTLVPATAQEFESLQRTLKKIEPIATSP